jgi:CRP-like cAMP-binding protein
MNGSRSSFDIQQWMDPATIGAFNAALRPRRFRAGQLIYIQGEPGAEMYRIESGSVRLSVAREDGREVVFLIFEPGDCFGNSSLVDGGARPQTAEALTDVLLGVIDRPAFVRLREDTTSFDDALLNLLARQMRVVSNHYVDSSLNDLRARLAARIVTAARTSGTLGTDGGGLSVRLSQAELASMVGVSRQSVNKMLQRFQREGLISADYGQILVKDLAALEQLCVGN